METWNIGGHDVEFIEDDHCYLVDGIILPSITTMMKLRFGGKYEGIDAQTLRNASELGTKMHLAIQEFEEKGVESDLVELRNYKFLKRQYEWNVIECETPVILFVDDEPFACGRVDMVAMIDDKVGIFDFKRTSSLDKEYLAYQLNLYRIAYRQTYGIEADFLRGIHLREDIRKFVPIPVNEPMTWEFLKEYRERKE